MLHFATLHPDIALRDYLAGKISVVTEDGSTENVAIYGDWEKPTNGVPADFISIYLNGDIEGLGSKANFANGNIMLGLYCKLNDDGTVKKNRVDNIMIQFDSLIQSLSTGGYLFEYDTPHFITPTTPNLTTGYSATVLNLRWHTTQDFTNK